MENIDLLKADWLGFLMETDAEFMEVLSSFNEEQINERPYPGSWTPGQVAEHVHKSDQGMFHLLTGPSKKPDRAPDLGIDPIKKTFLDFSTKLSSPDFIIPEDKLYEREVIETRFVRDRSAIAGALLNSDLSEICTAFPFPGFGEVSRLEVLVFIVSHTRRHVMQLRKISNLLMC